MCDKRVVAQFDYSGLSFDFAKLPKPAQRALINNKIFTPADLARKTLTEVSQFHGIGPSAIPVLRRALKKNGLRFRLSDSERSIPKHKVTPLSQKKYE
jgi:hypothetical protein